MVVCVIVWAPPGIPGKDGLGVGLESPCSQCCSRGSRVASGTKATEEAELAPTLYPAEAGPQAGFCKSGFKKKPQPRAPPSPEQGERRRQLWALRSEACGLLAWRHLPGSRQHPEGILPKYFQSKAFSLNCLPFFEIHFYHTSHWV